MAGEQVMGDMIFELVRLLDRVHDMEDFLHRLELFFYQKHHTWSPSIQATWKDQIERKRTQIDFEWRRVSQLGHAIACGREHHRLDI
jgi:hypothetical protein